MSFYLIWVLTLVIFTFLGQERVGFLSGYPMVVTKGRVGANQQPPKRCRCNHVRNVRLIFLFSCMAIIAVTILSTFFRGFQDVKIAMDDISDSALEVRGLAHKGQYLVNSLRTLGDYSKTVRDIILPDLKYPGFCVNAALDDQTGLPFNATRQQVVDDLTALGDFNIDPFKDMNDAPEDPLQVMTDELFTKIKSFAESTHNVITVYGIQRWQLLTYVISFCTIAALMMYSILFSWAGKPSSFLICTSTWLLLPIFIVLVMLSWIVVSTIGVAGVMISGKSHSTLWILMMKAMHF